MTLKHNWRPRFYMIKKTFFHVFSVVVLSLILFAACADSQIDEDFDLDYDSSMSGDSNLGGYVFTYRYGGDQAQLGDGCLGYRMGSPLDDEARQRISDIQTGMKCTIDVIIDPDTYSSFVQATTGGVYFGDAIWIQSDGIRDMAAIDGVEGITNLGIIDYTDTLKWGNQRMLEVFYYEDDLYGLFPSLWPEKADNHADCITVVNENIIARLGVTDPREYVESKTWTWAKFEEILPLYYNEEGGSVIHYALDTSAADMGYVFLYSNGGRLMVRDATGEYVPGYFTDTSFQAMDRAKKIYTGDLSYTLNKAGGVDAFVNGKSAMIITNAANITGPAAKISLGMDNFGILNSPLGPSAPEDLTYTTYSNLQGSLAISKYAMDLDSTATILDALYAPLMENGTAEGMIDYLRRNYFFDDRDASVYYYMTRNSYYTYFHWSEINDTIWQYISSPKSVTEYIQSKKDKLTESLEKYVMPSVRGMNAVWGEGTY